MASLIYNSCLEDWARGGIDFDTDTIKVMLVTSAYVPDKDAHVRRSSITNEVAAAGGYVAGGFAAVINVVLDTVTDRLNISLGGISVPAATITARGAVYYKSRGGAASADEIICYNDFGADVASTSGTWALSASTLRVQN